MASTISAGTTSGTAIAITGDTTGALSLLTNNGTTAVTIDTSQNVGIGTSNAAPSVNGKGITVFATDFPRITLRNNATGDTTADGTQFYNNGTDFVLNQADGGSLQFLTNSTERMRIDSSGNLLVGTTSNTRTAKFRVFKSGDNVMETETDNTGTGFIHIGFVNPNGRVGYIATSGSTTAYNTSSDYRLKNTIAPMTGALAKVALLKPCTYKWIADGSDGQGFIAHELAEVVPGCVTGEKDAVDAEGKPKYQGIDTSFLVATLTSAIQEQQALITALTTRITALEAK